MRHFYNIAVPHQDVLQGKLTPEVFAAHLGQVVKGEGPLEYSDRDLFWEKTYETHGLKKLLSGVEKRLTGAGGDPVIQIRTPFGGGKTHSLIAMYHKAREWKAHRVVIVGTEIDVKKVTLWGLLEEQLTGRIERFNQLTPPGSDALCKLLSENAPVLILMDELLQYATKAAGVAVEGSTLGAQTVAFMQELVEAASISDKVSLVLTLPSREEEHYDHTAESLFLQLEKVAGRVKMNYTPVANNEIAQVIRQRLFSDVDKVSASQVIGDFITYARQESLLPPGTDPSKYRKRFEASYPFLPDTIDVLYQQWGSYPTFQRTRGVLRLLASVIHSLDGKAVPYISLADFDLSVDNIQQDLLEHIGMEYNGVISLDIIGDDAGAKKVDGSFQDAYNGFTAGSRSATTVFMYSFSGRKKQTGATLSEIKRNAITTGGNYLASVVGDAMEQLRGKLFHLEHDGDRYYFTNQVNLNSILHTKMENIEDDAIDKSEDDLLKKSHSGGKLNTYVWRENGKGIPDDEALKLVILKEYDETLMKQILETKGKGHAPRENPNTLFFLTPRANEKMAFQRQLREILAYQAIENDKTLTLSDAQKKKVQADRKKAEGGLSATLLRYYQTVCIPAKDGFKKIDLTPRDTMNLEAVVHASLIAKSEILETYHPKVIREEYLKTDGIETVTTEMLYHTSAKKLGAQRVTNRDVWESGIRDGVKEGLFGLGKLENGKLVLLAFREEPPAVSFSSDEVIIRDDICRKLKKEKPPNEGNADDDFQNGEENGHPEPDNGGGNTSPKKHTTFHEKFSVPKGKTQGLMGVITMLGLKFDSLKIELSATDGEMSNQDYEMIKDAFDKLDIEPE